MTMICPWATEWDLMVGVDKHNELCIPPAPPLPPLPSDMHTHLVAATMRWATNSGQFGPPTVFVENRAPCKFFHDISFFIPHLPVPLPGWALLPAIITFSSAKVAFGSFSVCSTGEPVGVCGQTLNCWSNFPRPAGTIIPTRLPTVFVGISFVDVFWSLGHVAFDMLVSLGINKFFDARIKKRLTKFLEERLKKIASDYVGAEMITVINQIVVKLAGDVAKKLTGKLGKAILSFLEETVKDWFTRTNPGMQEKYIVIFEAEATHKLAAYLHETWLPQIEQASHESLQCDSLELHALFLEGLPPSISLQEFENAIQETIGPMIKDATRGLLLGDEWKKLLTPHRSPSGRQIAPLP